MIFDKKNFIDKANGILDDLETGKLTSQSWIWMGLGAVGGLLLSCFRLRRRTGKPILAKFDKVDTIEKKGRF